MTTTCAKNAQKNAENVKQNVERWRLYDERLLWRHGCNDVDFYAVRNYSTGCIDYVDSEAG